MLVLHKDSHLDHGLTPEQRDYLLNLLKDKDKFFIETVALPEHLGQVFCGLYGPKMGDSPVLEGDVFYQKRGNRSNLSRLVRWPQRMVREVTVIGGPYEDLPCIVYTIFGGPLAPKEPGDVTIKSESERLESERFWAEHALSAPNS